MLPKIRILQEMENRSKVNYNELQYYAVVHNNWKILTNCKQTENSRVCLSVSSRSSLQFFLIIELQINY